MRVDVSVFEFLGRTKSCICREIETGKLSPDALVLANALSCMLDRLQKNQTPLREAIDTFNKLATVDSRYFENPPGFGDEDVLEGGNEPDLPPSALVEYPPTEVGYGFGGG